jgi:photosystem II stability/assembly factor-like uncharacterized protein
MANSSSRYFLLGTMNGLFKAEANGDGYKARPLGLQGMGQVRYPVIDAEDPRRIYAATLCEGVQRSDDGGQTWHEANKGILYKSIFSLAQNPRTYELYAGTEPASVFKSTNGGDSWSDCPELRELPETLHWTFPRPPHVAHVKHIDVTADAPGRILGAVEEGWIVRSVDDGDTWVNVKDHVEFDSHTVTTLPGDPNRVISTSGQGFFRSEDGGAHFEKSVEGLECTYMAAAVVHPERPDVLFTAAAEVPPPFWRRPSGAAAGFFRSENQGKSWQRLKGGLPELITAAPRATAGDPEDPNAFFVGLMDGSVWMTEDGGESFSQIITGVPPVQSIVAAYR